MDTQDIDTQEPEQREQPPEQPAQPPEPAAEAPVRPRRRGRTALIIAAAAVIGIVSGTAVGYGIQAEREPTPLPALSQAGLSYPAKPLPESERPAPLSAAEDHKVKTDGDLRKLLVAKPSGARKARDEWLVDGWTDTRSYALGFDSEDFMFENLVEADIRRVASAAWEQSQYRVTTVQLVQFRSAKAAMEHAQGQQDYMPDEEEGAGNEGDALKGSGNGRYYLYDVEEKAGYLPLYVARAIVQRGDIMVDIHMIDTKRISKNDIRTVAERQLERL
ncbi:hypothetical protein ABZ611_28930 [Streptomyces sp. NPDC007861]|uniref:hypothetical protein n=1 Tax=Streptomyces sp. NPDC007861 TaxID=3154893 RepID=UPI00340294DB